MKFTYTATVRNDLDTVWAFNMDFERKPEWIYFYEKSYVSYQTEGWVGTRYKDKLDFIGIPLYIEYKMLEYEDKKRFRAKSKFPPFYPEIEVVTKDNGNGTVTSSLTFDMKLGPFALLPKRMLQKKVDDFIQPALDRYIEILDQD